MRHLADTIVEYVAKESARDGTFRFILPSYPPALLLRVGLELEERLVRVVGRRVAFHYGIACRLGERWRGSPSAADRAAFERMRARGWHNQDDNLTSLRNRVRDANAEDTLVSVIAGYDHIDDRASLQDFFHLDDRAIWEICLRRSFKKWVEARFAPVLDPSDHASAIDQIADALEALHAYGLADLAAISSYLEQLSLADVGTGREAYRLVLSQLTAFELPPMPGLAAGDRRRALRSYLGPAQEFLNYGAFVDESARRRATRALSSFREEGPRELEEEALGGFQDRDQLLDSLQRYIDSGSEEDRKQLLTADFVFIHDQVLRHRPRQPSGPSPRRPSVSKLSGLAPEVFLQALWLTLGGYCEESRSSSFVPGEHLRGITLRSRQFRHDYDPSREDAAGGEGDSELAGAFLRKVLGGIDRLLEEHIELGGRWSREPIPLRSFLSPGEPGTELAYRKSSVAEPALRFEVVLECDDGPFSREFLWRLPQVHQSRLLVDLYDWALDAFRQGGNALPAYALPYLPQVFMARDEEEVSRLVGVAIGQKSRRQAIDLLTAAGIAAQDPALTPLCNLSATFQAFLRQFERAGFYAALDSRYDELRQAYSQACQAILRHSAESSLHALLIKAFLLVDSQSAREEPWKWQSYLPYAIATPLHPAVLDMIRHQHSFLCESFSARANDGLREADGRRFSERAWNRVTDLAQIVRPIFGTLKDTSPALDSDVSSYGYIHLVGNCPTPPAQISTRLLLEYDDSEDDDDIADAELFRETGTSALVCSTLLDYREVHPHADDGLTVGAYCGREIQPIIAGVDAYLKKLLRERDDRPYGLRITIFSTGRDDSSVTRWLDAWRHRWQEAELSPSKRHYGSCRISIAYRVVPGRQHEEQLARLLQRTPLDVMFFADFVRAGFSCFEDIAPQAIPDDGFRQFPVLEKPCCRIDEGGGASQRARVLSHRRFTLASLHAEVMARIGRSRAEPEWRHAVISQAHFQPWEGAVDAAHKSSTWVVCVDPSVDDHLLRRTASDGAREREIIGFGTGVGAHGENNFTVSTEQFALADVKRRIRSQLVARLGPWQSDVYDRVATSLISEASCMAGLSVVKATGPSEYVRDYVAYATLRKLLPRDEGAFCDEIISLDAFRHWFDDAPTGTRPDLLRLRAKVVDGYFDIEAQVLECKLAQSSESHLSQAHDQVASGLTWLIRCFEPRPQGRPIGIDDSPDQRCWWMQLHRLLASRGSTRRTSYKETLSALEWLAEGFFTITWQGAVVAFWTDSERPTLERETEWHLQIEGKEIAIPALTAGGQLVQSVCLEGTTVDIFSGVPEIGRTFRSSTPQAAAEPAAGQPAARASGAGPERGPGVAIAGRTAPQEPSTATVPDRAEPVEAPATPAVDRVFLGHTLPGRREVYWEFGHPDLPNRHILVFGASGTGKTYTIQALLCELGRARQNALIVDYTSGFTTNQLEEIVRQELGPRQHMVRQEPLPINPFRQQCEVIDDVQLEEAPSITAQRVTGVFSEVYQLGDQQKSALYTAIRDGLTNDATSFTLDDLVERLEAMGAAGGPVASSAATALSRIQPFVDMRPFGQEDPDSWETLYADSESRCHIIQLAGFSRDIARLITEFSLIDLYRYYRAQGSKDRPRVVVLDEVQNLDHSLGSPLGQLLTEGRKFGISLVLATQTLSSLDRDQRDRLFQASHKLFFKPADTELRPFAQILADATDERNEDWIRRLSSLARGECYSLGPARHDASGRLDMKKYFRIQILPLSERFWNATDQFPQDVRA